jgi:hypothetical protein
MASETVAQSRPADRASSRGRFSIWEWLWRSEALQSARAQLRLPQLRRQRLQRAQLAAELADSALDPIDPLRAGSSVPLALSLYREAVYWALSAQSEASDIADLKAAFAAASQPMLESVAGHRERLADVRVALVDKTFVHTADDASEIVQRDAALVHDFAHALIQRTIDQEERVGTVLVQRWLRTGATLLILVVAIAGATLAWKRHSQVPDLAAGKPWRTSTKAMDCKPKEHDCGGAKTSILFHTLEERDPWFEIDLGSSRTFSVVEVINRSDCCPDRAIPLVVEARANDSDRWQQLARRVEAFQEWQARFKPVKAHYVRVRVDRRSTLHLERVSVRAK